MKQYNTDTAAAWLSIKLFRIQNLFASQMQQLSVKTQKVVTVFCCVLFVVCSVWLILHPFKEKAKLSMPPAMVVSKQIKPGKSMQITEDEFQKVNQYKMTHEELLKTRPGLADSLNKVEQLYYSQKK